MNLFKMHLVFYIRGAFHQVEVWKTHAQAQFWQWKRKNLLKKGKKQEEMILVQGALRPSMMGSWEYIFPEECFAEVLAIMGIGRLVDAEIGLMAKSQLAVLRKMLGVKKIPKKILEEAKKIPPTISLTNSTRGLHHLMIPGVTIHFIGYREDVRKDAIFDEKTQFHQEMI